MFQVRTDLALETKEKFEEDNVELKGVRIHEEERGENIKITEVIIETENGAKSMGKPRGSYITIEAQEMTDGDDGYHREISEELAKVLRGMIPVNREELSVLVVGLGNREITPDALGPRVADNMMITRHVIREFGKYALGAEHSNLIQQYRTGGHGTDRNGELRDHPGSHPGDRAGLYRSCGRISGKKCETAEPDHSDHQYRNQSGLRRGKPQTWAEP